jgi:hypothetical protein
MTTMITPTKGAPATGRRRRPHKVVLISACVLVLAAIAAGLGFWRYAATYAPLNPGPFFGGYPGEVNPRAIVMKDTDLGLEIYLDGPTGTEAEVITALSNDGDRDVTIERIETDRSVIPKVEWSPYRETPNSDGTGVRLPLRSFPATIPARHLIRVVVTLRKPLCPPGISVNVDRLIVHWHALGVDHVYWFPFGDAMDATYVGCPHSLR